jgi:zinc transporter 1
LEFDLGHLTFSWTLVKSASFILLQGVPTSITLEDLREDIRRVRGVTSVHELHVWQLSESKIIASVHVCVDLGVEYMKVAADIREVLHDYNVHSCTIQPEYDVDNDGKPLQITVCV